jgi:hypothetical protein
VINLRRISIDIFLVSKQQFELAFSYLWLSQNDLKTEARPKNAHREILTLQQASTAEVGQQITHEGHRKMSFCCLNNNQ